MIQAHLFSPKQPRIPTASWNNLPCEMKEKVFKYVRLEDRFDTLKVSQEWFNLTFSTVDFGDARCKELCEFGNKLQEDVCKKSLNAIEICSKKRIHIDTNTFRMNMPHLIPFLEAIEEIEVDTTMDEYCVLLQESNFVYVNIANHNDKRLSRLPEIRSFTINTRLRPFSVAGITKAYIVITCMKAAKRLPGSLKYFTSLRELFINTTVIPVSWKHIIPSSVKSLTVCTDENMAINTCALEGRLTLSYLCERWEDLEYFNYNFDYRCLPPKRSEYLHQCWETYRAGNLNHSSLVMKKVEILELNDPSMATNSIPSSVTGLTLFNIQSSEVIILKNLHENAANLTRVDLSRFHRQQLSVDFTDCTSLNSVVLRNPTIATLTSLLQACECTLLNLEISGDNVRIEKVSSSLKANTLREFKGCCLLDGMDELNHRFPNVERLTLSSWNPSNAQIFPAYLNKLKLFSATFKHGYGHFVRDLFYKSTHSYRAIVIEDDVKTICCTKNISDMRYVLQRAVLRKDKVYIVCLSGMSSTYIRELLEKKTKFITHNELESALKTSN